MDPMSNEDLQKSLLKSETEVTLTSLYTSEESSKLSVSNNDSQHYDHFFQPLDKRDTLTYDETKESKKTSVNDQYEKRLIMNLSKTKTSTDSQQNFSWNPNNSNKTGLIMNNVGMHSMATMPPSGIMGVSSSMLRIGIGGRRDTLTYDEMNPSPSLEGRKNESFSTTSEELDELMIKTVADVVLTIDHEEHETKIMKNEITLETNDQRTSSNENAVIKSQKLSYIKSRFISTFEVIIAKLFFAGFFWQSAATLSGLDSQTFAFAIVTGIGEATGVFFGNLLYDMVKKSSVDSSINLTASLQTSIFLSTATFCSGTSWQPIVNMFKNIGLGFLGTFVGTWIFCTFAFNSGLRLGRNVYWNTLSFIEKPTWENSRNDFALSVTIGGATAFFVGTDTSFSPEDNFLYHIVGIQENMNDLIGAILAGSSTALGFGITQSVLNIIYPPETCWID